MRNLIATFLFCALFAFSGIAAASDYAEEAEAVKLLNELRAEVGLHSLKWNPNSKLQAAAKMRAQELEEVFSHTRPDGTSCFTVLGEFGIGYRVCAENIAYGTWLDAEGVIELWRNSPGHYANMTNSEINEVGLAAWHDDSGNVYWVQLFIG